MAPDIIVSINLAIRSFGIGVLSGAIATTASFFSEFYEFHENPIRAKICFGSVVRYFFSCTILVRNMGIYRSVDYIHLLTMAIGRPSVGRFDHIML